MTDTTTPRPLPCGTWPSPITAADVAGQYRQVSNPVAIDGEVWWQEILPGEQGRTTVVHLGQETKPRQVLPAPWDARTRVHEYGGRSYLPVRPARPGRARRGAGRPWAIVFANFADQRLYLADQPGPDDAGATPRPLTPAPPGEPGTTDLRYADFALSPDGGEVWCVQERHESGKVARAIVGVPLDGSAAEDPDLVRELVSGADCYAFPTPSPDGSRLAWVCWNHPRMPWDGTDLRVARVDDGMPGKGALVKGGIGESVLAPLWHGDTSLYLISDWPGWWNLYTLDLAAGLEALYPAEEEFAGPLWRLGERPYGVLADGRLAVLHRDGMRLGVLDPGTGELADLDIPYRIVSSGLSVDGMSVVAVAGGPSAAMSVIRVDMTTGKAKKLYSPARRLPPAGYLPKARKLDFEGKFGQRLHAWVYPPGNPQAAAREGELPPYVVWAHGGPASQADRRLDLEKAYFTSRGIGVIDVNYGGSTGYGRVYRERLRRHWGVVDVQDAIAAAQALVSSGDADGARLAIRGGSAGGWTALAAVTSHAADSPFRAAVSYYGVTDAEGFAASTHDFESRYTDGLIGPLPGFTATYAERSPARQVSARTCPVLLLQGQDDPIVVPDQARALAAQLAHHGIPHALLEFDGESHGFCRPETITAALEAELSLYAQALNFPHPDTPVLRLHTTAPEPPTPEPAPPAEPPSVPETPPATSPAEEAAAAPPARREAVAQEEPSRA